MKVKKILSALLIGILTSCKFLIGEDDELTFRKEAFNEKSLRLDGYYFEGGTNEDDVVTVYFLYRNGIIFSVGSFPFPDLDQEETSFNDSYLVEKSKKIKFLWGLFKVDEDSISFEKWYPSSGPNLAYIREGIILNDSTFVIKRLMRYDGSDISNVDEVYHFREFNPKPDSTNSFID